MDVIVPFSWILSNQKLKKLNSGSCLQKYLCTVGVENKKCFLSLKKTRRDKFTIKLFGVNYSLQKVRIMCQMDSFRADTLTQIDSTILKTSRRRFNIVRKLKSSLQKEINHENKLILKGKLKLMDLSDTNVIIPFKWILSQQKIGKLNISSGLRKHACNVKDKKLCLTLKKTLCSNLTNIKLSVTKGSELKFLKIGSKINFFRADTLTQIDSKKLKISTNKGSIKKLLTSAVQNEINQEKKLIVKGKFKILTLLNRKKFVTVDKLVLAKKKSVIVEKPVSTDIVQAHDTSEKSSDILHRKEEFINIQHASTIIPGSLFNCPIEEDLPKDVEITNNKHTSNIVENSVSCNVVKDTSKNLKIINDKLVSTVMLHDTINCQVVEDLSKDLETIFNNDICSDVIITCQSQEFKAHKSIIVARCPALLFKNLKSEQVDINVVSKISIDSLPVLVVKTLLFYIYTGKLEAVTLDLACDLIYAANMYNLQTLKDICIDFVVNSLNNENVIFIYSYSCSFDELLKSYALKYISENFSSVSNSTAWKQLKSARLDLTNDILSEIVKYKIPQIIDLTSE